MGHNLHHWTNLTGKNLSFFPPSWFCTDFIIRNMQQSIDQYGSRFISQIQNKSVFYRAVWLPCLPPALHQECNSHCGSVLLLIAGICNRLAVARALCCPDRSRFFIIQDSRGQMYKLNTVSSVQIGNLPRWLVG